MTQLYNIKEPDLIKKGFFLEKTHPATQLSEFNAPNDDSANDDDQKAAYAALVTAKNFKLNYAAEGRQPEQLGRQAPPKISLKQTPLEGFCPSRSPVNCPPATRRYRTHDGTCNNGRKSRWGSAHLPFHRFLAPAYSDGIENIRRSVIGDAPLASARFISLLVHGTNDEESPVTLLLAQWGQFIDHDITSTLQPRSINGSVPQCCNIDEELHPSCLPIKVPNDDPWLAPLGVNCLEFLRSAPTQRQDCILSWREQTNQVTSYLDASTIYSSNSRSPDNIRAFHRGFLLFGRGAPEEDVCLRGALAKKCIRPGDARSNEQPGLLAIHHIMVSEHNRIANILSNLNVHWSDEKLYQETRRIIGAMVQHITYREFLSLVLGKEVCRLFDLELKPDGYYKGYDIKVNPTVANSFSAAAFRFGHSLIQGSYMRSNHNHQFINNNVTLHEESSIGDMGSIGSLHRLLRGLAIQRSQKRDEFITAELTNHLFQSGSFPFGLDLAAINIQRGRDHGIPAYTQWREPCGLSPIRDWQDLARVVGFDTTKRIQQGYRHIDDVDLFVAGLAERPVIGGLVGPTFACIIAQQFSNLRKGDRFWYENDGFDSSFTPAQLQSIRKVSLSQLVCSVLGGGTLQPHVFLPHDLPTNQRLHCGVGIMAPIDLRPWLERDPFFPAQFDEKLSLTTPVQQPQQPFLNNNDSRKQSDKLSIDMVRDKIDEFQKPNDNFVGDKLLLDNNTHFVDNKLDFVRKPTRKPPIRHGQLTNNKLGPITTVKPNNKRVTTKRTTTKRRQTVNKKQTLTNRRGVAATTTRPTRRTRPVQKRQKPKPRQLNKRDILNQLKILTNLTNKTKINTETTPQTKQIVIIKPSNQSPYEIEIKIRPTKQNTTFNINHNNGDVDDIDNDDVDDDDNNDNDNDNDYDHDNTYSTPFRPIDNFSSTGTPFSYDTTTEQYFTFHKPINNNRPYHWTTGQPIQPDYGDYITTSNRPYNDNNYNNNYNTNNNYRPTYNEYNKPQRPYFDYTNKYPINLPTKLDFEQTTTDNNRPTTSYNYRPNNNNNNNQYFSNNKWTTKRPIYLENKNKYPAQQTQQYFNQIMTQKPLTTHRPNSNRPNIIYIDTNDKNWRRRVSIRTGDGIPTNNDYDTDLPLEHKQLPLTNITINNNMDKNVTDKNDDKDYDFDPTNTEISFDFDGYLRPEHSNFNETFIKINNQIDKISDDDFILPILTKLQKPKDNLTIITNDDDLLHGTMIIGRHKAIDISSDEDDKLVIKTINEQHKIKQNKTNTMTTKLPINMTKLRNNLVNKRKKPFPILSIVPFEVLTKPERPDNWIVFDVIHSNGTERLPESPELETVPNAIKETPKPFFSNRN